MRRFIAAALIATGTASLADSASACTADPSGSPALQLSARQLARAHTVDVRAGGTVVLEACGRVAVPGHVPFAPSAVLHLTADRPRHALVIRAEAACAPMLLVETARGNRIVAVQPAGGESVRIALAEPVSGRYAVWVGTRDAFGCDARLVLRTERTTRAERRNAIR